MIRGFDLKWAKGRRTWGFFRWALFAAGLSLALYLPYRYATNPPTMPGLYAFLFPLSSILAGAGMVLALRPGFSSLLNTFVRAGIAAVAVLWLVAGMACIPSLGFKILSAPAAGLLATFQMFVQHVFLPGFVGAFALKPLDTCAWFGLTAPVQEDHEEAAVTAHAKVRSAGPPSPTHGHCRLPNP